MNTPFEIDKALAVTGGDHDLVRGLIRLFLEDYPLLIVAIARALEEGDSEGVRLAAQSMRGASESIGATDVNHSAGKIEESARCGLMVEAAEFLEQLRANLSDFENAADIHFKGAV